MCVILKLLEGGMAYGVVLRVGEVGHTLHRHFLIELLEYVYEFKPYQKKETKSIVSIC